MAARHGTRSKYVSGCRCDACKLAEAEYQKARRHGVATPAKPGRPKKDNVTAIARGAESAPPVDQPKEPGPVEAGVLLELTGMPAVDTRQGLYQAALALARILDNPLTVAQHPSAAKQLGDFLTQLRKGAERQGRLAAVRQMSSPKTATG